MHRRFVFPAILAAVLGLSVSSCDKAKEAAASAIPKEVSGLSGVLKAATDKLSAITTGDPAKAVENATAAVPDLTTAGAQLGSVSGLMDKLPGPAKEMVAKVLAEFGDKIKDLLTKAQAIPGVGDKIGAVAKTIIDHIDKLKALK